MDNDFSEIVLHRARLAVEYLYESIQLNGRFIYEADLNLKEILNTYNIVRHAGCVYVLYQWSNNFKDNNVRDSLDLATRCLKDHLMVIGNGRLGCCVADSHNVKIGASALTLLMMLERYHYKPLEEDLKIIKDLAKFLIWMQEQNGRFISGMLVHEPYVLMSDFVGIYYPGQAILALIRLYKIDPDPRWIKGACLGIDHLIKHPVLDSPEDPDSLRDHNHWFATALQEYFMLTNDWDIYNELTLIAEDTIVSIDKNNENNPESRLSVAAMATRGETILAALNVEIYLKNIKKIDYLKSILCKVVSYCIELQVVRHRGFKGFNPRGGFIRNHQHNKVRIDYTQHVLHILIGLLKIFGQKNTTNLQ